MGLFTKDIKSFDDLFAHGLKDIFYAENQIIEALPKMIEAAVNRDLQSSLKHHLQETRDQVKRLEEVFRLRGEDPQATRCPAIDGLLKEGDTVMGEIENETVMDAAVVAAAQAVEHYEICRYGALIAWAIEMGRGDIARVLKATLEEEKAADKKLTALAEARINVRAVGKRPPARRPQSAKAQRPAAGRRQAARPTKTSRKTSKAGKRPAPRRAR